MPEADDLLTGHIAVQMGLIGPGMLDRLVMLARQAGKPLADLLVERGAASAADLRKIAELRGLRVNGEPPESPGRREAHFAAKQFVREGILTPEAADECLRELVIEGEKRSFEDLLVERGVVARERADELKGLREKRSMRCPRCKLNFTVRSATGRKVVDCPKCKQPLQEISGAPARREDTVEFQTTVIKRADLGLPLPAPSRERDTKITVNCIICDALFDSLLDENDRVKCPKCGSSFVPRA